MTLSSFRRVSEVLTFAALVLAVCHTGCLPPEALLVSSVTPRVFEEKCLDCGFITITLTHPPGDGTTYRVRWYRDVSPRPTFETSPLADVNTDPAIGRAARVSVPRAIVEDTGRLIMRVSKQNGLQAFFEIQVVPAAPPGLTSIDPTTVPAGTGGLEINVTGSNFTNEVQFLWNGSTRPSSIFGQTIGLMMVLPEDLARPGTAIVQARNKRSGEVSDELEFERTATPVIRRLEPASAEVGSPDLELVVGASNIGDSAVVRWNGADHASTSVSQLRRIVTIIPASDLANVTTANVTVFDPDTGLVSAPVEFDVTALPSARTYDRVEIASSADARFRGVFAPGGVADDGTVVFGGRAAAGNDQYVLAGDGRKPATIVYDAASIGVATDFVRMSPARLASRRGIVFRGGVDDGSSVPWLWRGNLDGDEPVALVQSCSANPQSDWDLLDPTSDRALTEFSVSGSGDVVFVSGVCAGGSALVWHPGDDTLETLGFWTIPSEFDFFSPGRLAVAPSGNRMVFSVEPGFSPPAYVSELRGEPSAAFNPVAYPDVEDFRSVDINDAGTVACAMTLSTLDPSRRIATISEGVLEVVVDDDSNKAFGGFDFTDFEDVAINNGGDVAFVGRQAGRRGLFVREPDYDVIQVVSESDSWDGATIIQLIWQEAAFNEAGQLAVELRLDDGRRVIARFDPVPPAPPANGAGGGLEPPTVFPPTVTTTAAVDVESGLVEFRQEIRMLESQEPVSAILLSFDDGRFELDRFSPGDVVGRFSFRIEIPITPLREDLPGELRVMSSSTDELTARAIVTSVPPDLLLLFAVSEIPDPTGETLLTATFRNTPRGPVFECATDELPPEFHLTLDLPLTWSTAPILRVDDVDVLALESTLNSSGGEKAIVNESVAIEGILESLFDRGDPNADGMSDISDGVFTLLWLFVGGAAPECLDSADSNDDGLIDLGDPSYLLRGLFMGGPVPPEPWGECGVDPTTDTLTCESSAPCRG